MSEIDNCIKVRCGGGGYNVLLYDGTLLAENIQGCEADAMLDKLNALVRAANLLETAIEYVRHGEGCSAEFGEQYRCRCGFRDFQNLLRECEPTPAGEGEKSD